MCDYSLQSVRSRAAKIGDKLVTKDFRTGTRGFASAEDLTIAVCVLPGTELAFASDVTHFGLAHNAPTTHQKKNGIHKKNLDLFRKKLLSNGIKLINASDTCSMANVTCKTCNCDPIFVCLDCCNEFDSLRYAKAHATATHNANLQETTLSTRASYICQNCFRESLEKQETITGKSGKKDNRPKRPQEDIAAMDESEDRSPQAALRAGREE